MEQARGKLMLASFLTLVASGIGFATRTAAGGPWEREFDLGQVQFGAILGAGFLGFGLMIFFGGILVEKFGYKKLLALAFVLHLVSAVMLFAANPLFDGWRESDPENATANVYSVLFWSAFLFSLCQGLYEAVINPLIAQIYPENKTHYLNILHAGWPAGMIIGGLFAAGFIGENAWFVEIPWQWALSSFAIVVIIYGVLILPEKLPETVGESSGSFGTVFSCFTSIPFLVLIVLHALIGYMELGVDAWMTKLMENLLPNSVLILVYTSLLMFVLRFFAGPIVHKVNPIGLLFGSSIIACLGLLWLGSPIQSVAMIFVAATFYSLGKAFLWPTMLGVAGERYPQSGSVAMGALGAAGMLCVGQIAGPRIGTQQGYEMSERLQQAAPETFERYADADPISSWGLEYRPVNAAKLNAANNTEVVEGESVDTAAISNAQLIPDEDKPALVSNAATDIPAVKEANLYGGRRALTLTSYVPGMMAIGFLGLLIYFRSIGGYKVITLDGGSKDHEDTDDALEQPVPSEY
ncbi:MFS transporter [Roseiconus lacunae]|uniref:MFS transporter n=1 Tax=Roseiconus lacunae TaxID=2605694 RepID=A0ABT7PRR7_9BACT|nr:MFS transporter [Roseiconus lacunae]MCD0459168.1 MFS transporter [Roseiconus lacunae]MDM4018979.1 MFS transporter [Roseiconus lacunae]